MLIHWFENSHLTKAPGKEESDDSGAMGFMDLYTAASLTTMLPQYKECRGSACHGPCPRHEPFDYCAVDAWAGLGVFLVNRERLLKRGFNWKTYELRAELANYLCKMEARGIKIDRGFVANFGTYLEKVKAGYFPEDEHKQRIPFNPQSPTQAIEWFKPQGIILKSNQKNDIRKAVEVQASKAGFIWDAADPEDLDRQLMEATLTEPFATLFKLDQYKSSGKDPKGWFPDRFFDKDSCVHPRPIYVGTSTGRLSYAKPNFQNLYPLVKAAVVPHDPDFDIIDADLGQLEFRDVLFQAGYPIHTIPGSTQAGIRSTSFAIRSEKRPGLTEGVFPTPTPSGFSSMVLLYRDSERRRKPFYRAAHGAFWFGFFGDFGFLLEHQMQLSLG